MLPDRMTGVYPGIALWIGAVMMVVAEGQALPQKQEQGAGFVLLGHDSPFGRYPAPVVPVGELEGKLVAVYTKAPGEVVFDYLDRDVTYIRHDRALAARLSRYDCRTDRLFALGPQDVDAYSIEAEKEYLKSILSANSDPWLHTLLNPRIRRA